MNIFKKGAKFIKEHPIATAVGGVVLGLAPVVAAGVAIKKIAENNEEEDIEIITVDLDEVEVDEEV